MRDELHVMELVDRYLDGEMRYAERTAFEQRSGTDHELRGLIEEQRALREGLHRAHLRTVAAKAHRDWLIRRTLPYALGGVIVLSVAAYVMTGPHREASVEPSPAAVPVDAVVAVEPAPLDAVVAPPAGEGTDPLAEETHVESVFMHLSADMRRVERRPGSGHVVSYEIDEHGDTTSAQTTPTPPETRENEIRANDAIAVRTIDSTSGRERSQVSMRPLLATVELPVNAAQPRFPGGMEEMQRFIAENVKQPRGRRRSGVVTVGFTVNKKGEVVNVDVATGLDPAFDAEAMRVVRSMPQWQPARRGERPVKSRVEVPVRFTGKSPHA